jgi:hypothetical protein
VTNYTIIMPNAAPEAVDTDTYTLDLSGVATRQQMQDWDSAWISEYEQHFDDYEHQVDPGNGGQVSAWAGSGNPSTTPDDFRDYSQYIDHTALAAGSAVRIRIRFEYQDDGVWASFGSTNDVDNLTQYQCGYQSEELRFYKLWGPTEDDWSQVGPSESLVLTPGTTYWLYGTETRVADAVDGDATITCEILTDGLSSLKTNTGTDTGQWGTEPVVTSTTKRGFGGFYPANGNGCKIFEWILERKP